MRVSQELVDPLAWELEALRTCEGINHESAQTVEPALAGAQLALAAAHFAVRDAATEQRRRPRKTRTDEEQAIRPEMS